MPGMSADAGRAGFDPDFDGQKLMFHPERVAEWLRTGRTRGPLYTEIGLTDRCNSRCVFCGLDYRTNKACVDFEPAACRRVLRELKAMGNRAVMFSGEGEPLLHPQARSIIRYASRLMSASVTTNGLALTPDTVDLIDRLEWIRFSVNGGDRATYARVHGVPAAMFGKALDHVALCVARKRRLGLGVTVGVQMVLLDENAGSVLRLARRVRELGVDYFSVKPYSRHPLSGRRLRVDYSRYASLERDVVRLASDSFRVIWRAGSVARLQRGKPYGACYGLPFICYLSADGDVWACNVFLGDPRFRTGSVYEEGLERIWSGPRRKAVVKFVGGPFDLGECRDVCRMDSCNRYLWRLRHPLPHDNFI